MNDCEVSVRVAILESENNQGDAETEDDVSIEIAGDEARKETKAEEPSFLHYQRDLYRPEVDMGGGGELKSLIL